MVRAGGRMGGKQDADESPRLWRRLSTVPAAPGRFTLEPHCFARGKEGGEKGKLASYLTPCLNRGPQEPETRAKQRRTPFSFSSLVPPERPTLRHESAKLCANFAYILFGSVKGSHPASPPSAARGRTARPTLRNERPLDLLKIKFA